MNQCGHAECVSPPLPESAAVGSMCVQISSICVFHCCETKGTQAEGDPWVGWLLPCLCLCVCVCPLFPLIRLLSVNWHGMRTPILRSHH